MPRIYRAVLRVPHHELDPSGWLRAGSIVRLLQELAIDASADAGFDYDWYRAHGTNWIVRRTTIEIACPLPAGMAFEVETHVADFRRVRSVRVSLVRVPGEALPRVRCRTDWVYFDWATRRPASVPEEMVQAFATDGAEAPVRRSELRLDSIPASPFETRRIVERRDLDGLGHVNNAVWVDYVEEAVRQAVTRGFLATPAELGLGWPSHFDVMYLGEAREGQGLTSFVWRAAHDGPGLRACCEIRDAEGEPALRAIGTWTAGSK